MSEYVIPSLFALFVMCLISSSEFKEKKHNFLFSTYREAIVFPKEEDLSEED